MLRLAGPQVRYTAARVVENDELSATAGEADVAGGVRQGDLLAGKYRVERVVAIGGMGVVVVAHHAELDEKVAVKFLRSEALQNPDAVARFAHEARVMARIKSEHVVRVTDVGTLPNGARYMVMEYLEGVDLAERLERRGPLSVEQAVDFVLQACVAVADAHALGIVHQDIKPANLFCVRRSDGQFSIKVLDFGISKVMDAAASVSPSDARAAGLMGSPEYMSPEHMRAVGDTDPRTDIWALGVTLYELIAGRPPFAARSVPQLAAKIASEPPPSLTARRPHVPSGFEAVLFKCLAKDRRDRYRDVGELARALAPFGSSRARAYVERISGIIATARLAGPASPASAPGQEETTRPQVIDRPPARISERGVRPLHVGLAAGIVGVTILGAMALGHGGQPADDRARGSRSPIESAAVAENRPGPGSDDTPGPPTVALSALPAVLLHAPAVATASAVDWPASSPVRASRSGVVDAEGGPSTGPSSIAGQPEQTKAGSNAQCKPPYVIDSAGDRQYKPECL